MYEDKGKLN